MDNDRKVLFWFLGAVFILGILMGSLATYVMVNKDCGEYCLEVISYLDNQRPSGQ